MAKKWNKRNRINRMLEVATSMKGGGRGRQFKDIKIYEENLSRISGIALKRTKPIKTVKRFVVGWGRANDGRLTFFIQHKKISSGARIPCNPKDLEKMLTKFATQIDGGNHKRP